MSSVYQHYNHVDPSAVTAGSTADPTFNHYTHEVACQAEWIYNLVSESNAPNLSATGAQEAWTATTHGVVAPPTWTATEDGNTPMHYHQNTSAWSSLTDALGDYQPMPPTTLNMFKDVPTANYAGVVDAQQHQPDAGFTLPQIGDDANTHSIGHTIMTSTFTEHSAVNSYDHLSHTGSNTSNAYHKLLPLWSTSSLGLADLMQGVHQPSPTISPSFVDDTFVGLTTASPIPWLEKQWEEPVDSKLNQHSQLEVRSPLSLAPHADVDEELGGTVGTTEIDVAIAKIPAHSNEFTKRDFTLPTALEVLSTATAPISLTQAGLRRHIQPGSLFYLNEGLQRTAAMHFPKSSSLPRHLHHSRTPSLMSDASTSTGSTPPLRTPSPDKQAVGQKPIQAIDEDELHWDQLALKPHSLSGSISFYRNVSANSEDIGRTQCGVPGCDVALSGSTRANIRKVSSHFRIVHGLKSIWDTPKCKESLGTISCPWAGCDEASPGAKGFKCHILGHVGFVCPVCGGGYQSQNGFIRHLRANAAELVQ